jgi:hypothetical protein
MHAVRYDLLSKLDGQSVKRSVNISLHGVQGSKLGGKTVKVVQSWVKTLHSEADPQLMQVTMEVRRREENGDGAASTHVKEPLEAVCSVEGAASGDLMERMIDAEEVTERWLENASTAKGDKRVLLIEGVEPRETSVLVQGPNTSPVYRVR